MECVVAVVDSSHPQKTPSGSMCTSNGNTIYDADGKPVKYAEWRKVRQDKPVGIWEVLKAFQ